MNITRLDAVTVEIAVPHAPRIYANDKLHLERTALTELARFAQIDGLRHLAFTPDFHKGSGTPIGTVALADRAYPRVTGNDIGCGMRLDVLDVADVEPTPALAGRLRHAFFEGGREVFVADRRRLLAEGLGYRVDGASAEILPTTVRAHAGGRLGDGSVSQVLAPYLSLSSPRDNLLGSVGGGNHFVELQRVDEVVDRHAAHALGLRRGAVCVMVHSGSLDNGHQVGTTFKDIARAAWSGRQPGHGFFPLPPQAGRDYIRASANAANFAFVNRAIMAAMVARVLDCGLRQIWDAPHNHVVEQDGLFLHRKGACPAAEGEPVIVPGSMATRSFVGIGRGFAGTLASAPHGAGRVLSRNASRARPEDLDAVALVTKIDPAHVRRDVAREVMRDLAEEAPRAYKDVTEVVATSVAAGMVTPVAWLAPILTIKG